MTATMDAVDHALVTMGSPQPCDAGGAIEPRPRSVSTVPRAHCSRLGYQEQFLGGAQSID